MATDSLAETQSLPSLHHALRAKGDFERYKIAHPEVPLIPSQIKDRLLDAADSLLGRFSTGTKPEEEVTLLEQFQKDYASAEKASVSGTQEQQTQLTKESAHRLFDHVRTAGSINKLVGQLHDKLFSGREAIAAKPDQASVVTADQDKKYSQRIKDLMTILYEQLPFQDPESFLAHNLLTLRKYKQELKSDLVITESIQDLKDQIVLKLTQHGVVALVGETGTGKTKMAKLIAEENFDRFHKGEEGAHYYFVMGHKYTSKEDLLSYLGITATTEDATKVPDLITKAKEAYTAKKQNPPEEDLNAIAEIIKGQAQNVRLQTEEIMGVAFKSAEEGKNMIVDEFNYINPALVASLNELMQVRPGQTLTTASGKVITVKEGFGVMFTGNLSLANAKRYIERYSLDPALINRLNSGLFEYNTPPMNDIDKPLVSAIVTEVKRKSGEKAPNRELFQIALTELVDAKGNLYAPEDALEQVWKMTQAFKVFQDNFAGKPIRTDADKLTTDMGPVELRLQHSHASMRTMRRIIESWKSDNFRLPLEYYLYEQLIRPSSVIAPTEAAYFHSVLKNKYSFFVSDFWNDALSIDSTTKNIKIKQNTEVEAKKQPQTSKMKLFSSQEIAQAFSGYEMPQEVTRQKGASQETDEALIEKIALKQQEVADIIAFRQKIEETINLFCADEAAIMGS